MQQPRADYPQPALGDPKPKSYVYLKQVAGNRFVDIGHVPTYDSAKPLC